MIHAGFQDPCEAPGLAAVPPREDSADPGETLVPKSRDARCGVLGSARTGFPGETAVVIGQTDSDLLPGAGEAHSPKRGSVRYFKG